jgi:hypothetical protein
MSKSIEVEGVTAHVDQELRNVRTDDAAEKAGLSAARSIVARGTFSNEAEVRVKIEVSAEQIAVVVAKA